MTCMHAYTKKFPLARHMHACFQKKIRLPVTCMDAYTKKFPLAHDMHAYMATYIIAKANL